MNQTKSLFLVAGAIMILQSFMLVRAIYLPKKLAIFFAKIQQNSVNFGLLAERIQQREIDLSDLIKPEISS